VPAAAGSWVLPLDVRRRGPGAGTPTELALAQLRAVQATRPADAARPVVTFDSSYDAVALAQAIADPEPSQRLAVDALVRLVERLPRSRRTPEPLWLAWLGAALPDDLLQLWRWYARRFTLEHGFRFLKQALGWTTVRPRAPAAADRWSWLLAAGLWQLWLARG